MGRLRIEPRVKPPVTSEEYQQIKKILNEAESASTENYVFWDLEPKESTAKVRKKFQYVAEKERIPLTIRSKRGSHSLALKFGSASRASGGRMSAEESRSRIISALKESKEPLQKSDIIDKTGVSPSTWNLRIKELLDQGAVEKHGAGRQTRYTAA